MPRSICLHAQEGSDTYRIPGIGRQKVEGRFLLVAAKAARGCKSSRQTNVKQVASPRARDDMDTGVAPSP